MGASDCLVGGVFTREGLFWAMGGISTEYTLTIPRDLIRKNVMNEKAKCLVSRNTQVFAE